MPRRQVLQYTPPQQQQQQQQVAVAPPQPPPPASQSQALHAHDPTLALSPTFTAGMTAAFPTPINGTHIQPVSRHPLRRRRDDLSDDDDDDNNDGGDQLGTRHIRKWIRTDSVSIPPDHNSNSDPTPLCQEQDMEMPHVPAVPLSTVAQSAVRSASYFCSAPNCSAPPSTAFSTLAAIEAHIRKHHHYICYATRPPRSSSSSSASRKCNAVFPSNHLLDLHLNQAHSPLFWAQVARGDSNLFPCFVPGCRTMMDTMGDDHKAHVLSAHRWSLGHYDEVKRQVMKGATQYLDAESSTEGDLGQPCDYHTMQVDAVVDTIMRMDTNGEQDGNSS